jgi:hypothetical protein
VIERSRPGPGSSPAAEMQIRRRTPLHRLQDVAEPRREDRGGRATAPTQCRDYHILPSQRLHECGTLQHIPTQHHEPLVPHRKRLGAAGNRHHHMPHTERLYDHLPARAARRAKHD